MHVTMTVNGAQVSGEVEPRLLLVHFVRDHLGLTGTHWGCDTSQCGTCVLLMDGQPVKSCTVLAVMADGHDIRTVEGMEVDGTLDPVQQGFMHEHGLRCGFCTPGMMLTARWLLDHDPDPDDARAVCLRLTAAGHRRVHAFRDRIAQTVDGALAQLEPDERDALLTALPALRRLADTIAARNPS